MRRVLTFVGVYLALATSAASAQQQTKPQAAPPPQERPAAASNSDDLRPILDRCAELRQEHIKVLQTGIVQDMQRGPEWAKFHLSKERLGEIEKYITLEEQLKFTCREANLLIDPKSLFPPAPAANVAAAATPATEGQPKPKKSQKKKPKQSDAASSGIDLVWPGLAP